MLSDGVYKYKKTADCLSPNGIGGVGKTGKIKITAFVHCRLNVTVENLKILPCAVPKITIVRSGKHDGASSITPGFDVRGNVTQENNRENNILYGNFRDSDVIFSVFYDLWNEWDCEKMGKNADSQMVLRGGLRLQKQPRRQVDKKRVEIARFRLSANPWLYKTVRLKIDYIICDRRSVRWGAIRVVIIVASSGAGKQNRRVYSV